MSAVLAPSKAPSRRTLERNGMTPEEELELLIREQQADDVYTVRTPDGEISLDGSAASEAIGAVYDFDDFDPDASGEVVSFLPRPENESLFAPSLKHGLLSTYRRLKCKCAPCTAVATAYQREYRRKKREAKS